MISKSSKNKEKKYRVSNLKGLIKRLFLFSKEKYKLGSEKVRSSVRMQLLLVFVICLLSSTVAAYLYGNTFGKKKLIGGHIDYSYSMQTLDNRSQYIASTLTNANLSIKDRQNVSDQLQYLAAGGSLLIADLDGNIIYSYGDNTSVKIDIYNVVKKAMEGRNQTYAGERNLYYSIFPVKFTDYTAFVVLTEIPQGRVQYEYSDSSFGDFIVSVLSFVLIFLLLTKKKIRYIEEISQGLLEISKGDLNYRVAKRGTDELALLAENINIMEDRLKEKIEEEKQAEAIKNELITNVSHDLRTPLTSIMGYLGLLKDTENLTPEQKSEYINIAYNKSEKLKALIEDLFEYTKLSNAGIKLNEREFYLREFLEQLIEELVPLAEERELHFIKSFPEERFLVLGDVEKLLRVFENLIHNAIKYSSSPGDIEVKLYASEDKAVISISNRTENIAEEDLNRLFDRFYRMEKSRSSSAGGSGLGLAICKSIIELHRGKIWVETYENIITFYVELKRKLI